MQPSASRFVFQCSSRDYGAERSADFSACSRLHLKTCSSRARSRGHGHEKSSLHGAACRYLYPSTFATSVCALAPRGQVITGADYRRYCTHQMRDWSNLLTTLRRTRSGPRGVRTAICVQNANDQCVLQFTLLLAAGCVLHRRTSRAIHHRELSFICFGV